MIVRDLVVLILDVVVALIQGDFVGSLKYAGKGHPLKLFISLTDKQTWLQIQGRKQRASEESCSSPYML